MGHPADVFSRSATAYGEHPPIGNVPRSAVGLTAFILLHPARASGRSDDGTARISAAARTQGTPSGMRRVRPSGSHRQRAARSGLVVFEPLIQAKYQQSVARGNRNILLAGGHVTDRIGIDAAASLEPPQQVAGLRIER